jgi:prevent-host-death family protein
MVMQEAQPLTMPSLTGLAEAVSVRTAKATLSALLEKVAGGREILITSDGRPKARLVPVEADRPRKLFQGSGTPLAAMPAWPGGPDSTALISADRDERG